MIRKRLLCAMLGVCMLAAPSCTSQDEPDENKVGDSVTVPSNGEYDRLAELGERDFGNETYTVLDANDHPELHDNIPSDEADGDVINNELYKRDVFIEEKYGINIEYEQIVNAKTGCGVLRQNVMSDDDTYTVVISTLSGGSLTPLASEGILSELGSNEYLSLDKPWWSRLMYDSCRIDGKMYFTTGDFSPSMYQMASCMYINKDLCEKYNVDTDFVQLVLDGEWTWDVLAEVTKDMNTDVNQDGVMHASDDVFGFVHQKMNDVSVGAMLISSGASYTAENEAGELVMALNNEKTYDFIEKARGLICDIQFVDYWDVITKAFKEDRAVILMHLTEGGYMNLRDMESDYLIVPMPKDDVTQENYRCLANGWANAYIAIPKTSDPEFAGFITEAMGYYSYKNIRPAVYETAFKLKATRDDSGAQMLDIIFDSIYIDFGTITDFGGVTPGLVKVFTGQAEFASVMESVEDAANVALASFKDAWVGE